MVGYISKYLSYTQSCVGCIGRLVYSSKKLASGVARSIQKGLCVTVSFCRSTRFDYRSIQKGVCVTVSVEYRELTTQSIILSFDTLRLPFKSCDEVVLASICGSRNEYGEIE